MRYAYIWVNVVITGWDVDEATAHPLCWPEPAADVACLKRFAAVCVGLVSLLLVFLRPIASGARLLGCSTKMVILTEEGRGS